MLGWVAYHSFKGVEENMKDFNIILIDAFGREIKVSTEQIEEDVLRIRMKLEPQEQEGE